MSDDTQEQNEVDEVLAEQFHADGTYAGAYDDIHAQRVLAAEVRRLREEVSAARELIDQLSASNLRLVAEREQLKSELAECEAVYKERLVELVSLRTGANVLTRKLTAISVLIEMQHDESLIAVGDVRRALLDTK